MPAVTERQWRDFWHRLGTDCDPAPHWRSLVSAYSESWRQYHTLTHIGHCLSEFSAVSGLASVPLAVEAAIWFHDLVCDTRRKDNEERSAERAAQVLHDARMDKRFVTSVSSLILTTTHVHPPATSDAELLVDVDLSILGQSAEAYALFERQIRAEYSWVPANEFAIGRSAILRSFLSRPHVFTTSHFVKQYEASARRNLQWAIAALEG